MCICLGAADDAGDREQAVKTSRYYRDRAEEVRLMAAELEDKFAKTKLEDVAKTYDRLARLAEENLAINDNTPQKFYE